MNYYFRLMDLKILNWEGLYRKKIDIEDRMQTDNLLTYINTSPSRIKISFDRRILSECVSH